MTKICTRPVKLYDCGGDYRVEVIRLDDGEREVWLFRKDIGTKMLMFGVYEKGSELLATIEANLPEYTKIYKDLYVCDEY